MVVALAHHAVKFGVELIGFEFGDCHRVAAVSYRAGSALLAGLYGAEFLEQLLTAFNGAVVVALRKVDLGYVVLRHVGKLGICAHSIEFAHGGGVIAVDVGQITFVEVRSIAILLI